MWPTAAFAQQPTTTPVIGALMAMAADDADSKIRFQAFLQGLRAAGWTEGRNVRIETRWIGGDRERARTFAAELVGLRPNVILANTAMALQPLGQQTSTTSIVFVLVYDPVTSGFVSSLAYPGGNLTGFTLREFSLGGKMMEALDRAPLRRVGYEGAVFDELIGWRTKGENEICSHCWFAWYC